MKTSWTHETERYRYAERRDIPVFIELLADPEVCRWLWFTPIPAEGVAKLRAYHASADAPAKVDIAPDGAAKKKAVVKKLKFGKNTGFLELPAGEFDLAIRQPGTKKVLLDIGPLPLEAGKVYSAFAVTSPDGVTVIPNVDAETDAN